MAAKKRRKKVTKRVKEKLFILWNPESPMPPRVRFEDETKAREVAAHMARKTGEQFYVMQAVCLVEQLPAPVQVTEC